MSGIFDQIINYSPPLIVSGTVNYKGTWNASTNNPTLNNPPASSTKGDYYVVSTAGTQFTISFAVGDWIISSGTAWEKVDLTDAVSSVFGRTGAVVGVSTDYSSVGLTNTAIGAANPSTGAFTTVSATTPIAVASGGTGVSTSTGTTNVVLSNSPTIVTPVIAQINDANGNATLRLTGITSATDYLEIKNGIGVGSPLHVLAEGASTNIGVHLQPKGSGLFTISDGTDFAKGIRFRSSSSAASAVTLIDAVSTAGRVVTLPDATDTLVGRATTDTLTNKTLTSPTLTTPILGTPASGTVTNLTGTASININGTVGATTANTGAFTTGTFSGGVTLNNSDPTITLNRATSTGFSTIANLRTAGATTGGWDIYGSGAANQTINFYSHQAAAVVGSFTSTGLNSTAIGATTASTGAFTTVNIGGSATTAKLTINQSSDAITQGLLFWNAAATRNGGFYHGGSSIIGREDGVNVLAISSTGLAVTGALSASGAMTTTSQNGFILDYNTGSRIKSITASQSSPKDYLTILSAGNTGGWQGATRFGVSYNGGTVLYPLELSANTDGTTANVGIGTSAPDDLLHVFKGDSGLTTPHSYSALNVENSTHVAIQMMTPNNSESNIWFGDPESATVGGVKYYHVGNVMNLRAGEADRITIDGATGNVGIGTASPAEKLHVNSGSGVVPALFETTGVVSVIQFKDTNTTTGPYLGSFANALYFGTNSLERARIDSSGNVGIGTASPADTNNFGRGLDIQSSTGAAAYFRDSDNTAKYAVAGFFGADSNAYYGSFGTSTGVLFYSSGSERARIDSSGNLLVGQTSSGGNKPAGGICLRQPEYTAGSSSILISHATSTSNGNSYAEFSYDGTGIGNIVQSGTTAVIYNTTSDYRRKSNVKDLTGSGTFIDALKPRTFDWDTGDKAVGFIAHEFAEVSPSSVCGEKDAVDSEGKPVFQAMQASSAEVIANLVAELQSLRQRVAALESN